MYEKYEDPSDDLIDELENEIKQKDILICALLKSNGGNWRRLIVTWLVLR